MPGGSTCRESYLMMEVTFDSGMATSPDAVEINPLLDEQSHIVILLVDLIAGLTGRNASDQATCHLGIS